MNCAVPCIDRAASGGHNRSCGSTSCHLPQRIILKVEPREGGVESQRVSYHPLSTLPQPIIYMVESREGGIEGQRLSMACPAPSPRPLHPILSSTSARSFCRCLSQITALDKPVLKGPLELWHHELMPDTKQQPRLYTSIFQRIFHAFSLAHSVASPILRHAWQRVARIRVLVSLSLSLSPSLSGFRLRAWRSQKKQTTVSGSCAVEHK